MRLDYRTARLADILDISGMISSFAQHIWRGSGGASASLEVERRCREVKGSRSLESVLGSG